MKGKCCEAKKLIGNVENIVIKLLWELICINWRRNGEWDLIGGRKMPVWQDREEWLESSINFVPLTQMKSFIFHQIWLLLKYHIFLCILSIIMSILRPTYWHDLHSNFQQKYLASIECFQRSKKNCPGRQLLIMTSNENTQDAFSDTCIF